MGGLNSQGRAYGYLDGGRGIVAALIGSISVFIFSISLTNDINSSNILERKEAFKYVILFSFIFNFHSRIISPFIYENKRRC